MAGSITTGKGDAGTTGVLFGKRVPKGEPRLRVYGALDEAGAHLTVARTAIDTAHALTVDQLQRRMLRLGSEFACLPEDKERLASRGPLLDADALKELEALIHGLEGEGITFTDWVENLAPGYAHIEVARTVVRRAESLAWAHLRDELRPEAAAYLNRLSDALWLLARAKRPDGGKPTRP
jgi:cob(I)alamin adenosyltransferase